MTVQEMKERKKELGYTYEQIAELSGVPLGTVQKIFNGTTVSPRYDTVRALERVFKESEDMYVKEPAACYAVRKRQGEFTLDDYYAFPDESRVELIDGVIYDMASPSSVHQLMSGFIYTKLMEMIAARRGTCLPMISPIDVQLDCDDKTMVQPDVMIVCDRTKIINRCVYGAPDFIIEVLSKATGRKDAVVKLHKYMNAGVREYWIIDPYKKKVIAYDFENEGYPAIYGFESNVPIRFMGDGSGIDFEEVYEYVRFLYEK